MARREGRPGDIRYQDRFLTPIAAGSGSRQVNEGKRWGRSAVELEMKPVSSQTLTNAIKNITPCTQNETTEGTTKTKNGESLSGRSRSREPSAKLKQNLAVIREERDKQENEERGIGGRPKDPKRSIEINMKTQSIRNNEDRMEGESGNQRKIEDTSGFEKRIMEMVAEAVDTLINGMEGLRTGLTNRIEDSREELKATDLKWQEYRDDIKNKHDYNMRQQEFLERTESMVSKAMERWIVETQKNMD